MDRRSLPGWAIDLIRDGVPTADLRRHGDKAIYRALVRTAMSAHQRHWCRIEWEADILARTSRLGHQIGIRRDRPLSAKQISDRLGDAWDRAVTTCSQTPALDREQIATEALCLATASRTIAADADNDLTDAQRAILTYAADETSRRRLTRIPLPRRTVAAATGLTERCARTAVDALTRRGLLTLDIAGRSSSDASKRRAGLYRLTPYLYPVPGSMGHPARSMGHPESGSMGHAPDLWDTTESERQVLIAALMRLRQEAAAS